MELDPRMKLWIETGRDPQSGVNPPLKTPKQQEHIHFDGFDSRCGLCLRLRELARERWAGERPR